MCAIDLGTPGGYFAWGNNGKNEELAIATLLYNVHFLAKDTKGYWKVLNPDRENFYEYYTAIESFLASKSAKAVKTLREYVIVSYLYQIPFGSGKYEYGEPFRDLPDGTKGWWDENELYADLMFDVDEDGFIDINSPLQSYEESDLIVGQVSDAARSRRTIEPPSNGYLYLSGESVEYLLVDILAEGDDGNRTLRAVDDGKVLIGLPDRKLAGIVSVSLPGGNVIYEGDLAELQQRQIRTAGQDTPLAEAFITAADLAPPNTSVIATYGDINASGILTIPEMSYDELVSLSNGYDRNIDLEEVSAILATRENKSARLFNGKISATSAGVWLLYIAVGLGVLAIISLIIFLSLKRKHPHNSNQQLHNPSYQSAPEFEFAAQPTNICPHCNSIVLESDKFCTTCGRTISRTKTNVSCPNCGKLISANEKFCKNCGRKIT